MTISISNLFYDFSTSSSSFPPIFHTFILYLQDPEVCFILKDNDKSVFQVVKLLRRSFLSSRTCEKYYLKCENISMLIEESEIMENLYSLICYA